MFQSPALKYKQQVVKKLAQPVKTITRIEQAQQQVKQDALTIDLQHLKNLSKKKRIFFAEPAINLSVTADTYNP